MAKSRFASCSNFGTVNNKTSTNKKSRYSSVGILGSVSDKAATDYQAANQKELEKVWNDTFFNMLKPENGRLPNADTVARKMGYRNDTERQEYKKNNPEIYEAMGGIKCVGDSEKVLTNNLFQTNELKQLAKERLINRFNNADTAELSKIIDTLNSGEWQKADTMEKYSKKVNTYVNDYIALNELGYFNSVPEAERNEYRDILKNIKDNVQNYKDVFGEYEDAESYKKAESEAYQKMPTTDTVALQKEIDELNDDYNELVKLQRMRKAEHKSQIKSIQEVFYRDWGKLLSDEEAEAAIADNKILLYYDEKINKLLGDYANANDMKQALFEKKAYKTEVEREQKRIEIIQSLTNDALADVEFEKISTFKSKIKYNKSIINFGDVDSLILEYINGSKEIQKQINSIVHDELITEHSPNSLIVHKWSACGYDQLNEEEKKIATYYYKTNIEKFWEYLDANEFTWKNRGAKKLAEKMDNVFLGKTLTAIASANDRFIQSMVGIGNYITGNETYVEPTFAQLTSQYVRENLDGFDAFLYDAMDNFAYMTPSILMNAVLPGSGFVVTGISAAGNAYNEGINMGMSVNQARTYGTLIGVSEAGLESLISGIGGLTGKLTGIGIEKVVAGINSGIIKFVATLGINSISEGFEEFSQELLEPLFENIALGYSKNDWDDIDWDAAVYSGLLGAFMGGVSNVLPSAVKVSFDSINANVIYGSSIDSIKGLLQNGFAMPKDSVAYGQALKVESQLNNGKKLSGTTLYNLAAAIKSEIETKSTDRLAELGENKKIIKELSPVIAKTVFGEQLTSYDVYALKNSQYGNQVVKELSADRVNTIWRNAVENSRVGNSKNMQNAELHSDAYNSNNNDIYLLKSNGGETKQGQPFNIDLSQVKLKYQDTYKRAIESGYFNNTQQTHEFIQMLAEISADKGINFEFTDNEKVNNSGFAIKEKAVNGYVTRGTITLNVNSAKPFNSLVGHEITHVLERTRNFGDFNSLILKYAKQKGDYESRLAALTELYENAEGADVNKELVADLVGDYLFTDIDFVRRLFNENRNLFQRIYDEIMYLYRIVAAGSIEKLQLEIIKKTFEEVYRESENVEKIAENSDVKYSIIKTSKMPYPEQLQLIEKRQINGSNSLYIGEPSQQLQKVGLSEAPFAMNQSDYRKSRRAFGNNKNYSSHAVPYEFFENMPQYFADAPLLIDKGNKVSIITLYPMNDTKGQASYVIGGVWQNQQMENDAINLVKSVYPLDDFVEKISRAAEEGKLVVINKNKAEQMLATIGIQSSKVSRIVSLAKHTISQKAQSVNTSISENFKNDPAYSDSFINRDTYKKAAESGGNSLDLGLSEPAIADITHVPTAEESIAAAISGEQLDTKQRRILDFAERHFPHITVKFSGYMTKNGLWDSDSKTLLLNINQTVAGMYTEVFKHEFMHTLESKRLYQEFKQFLFNKDTAFGVWAKVQCKTHGIELLQNATAKDAINALCDYYYTTVKNDMTIAKKYRDTFTIDGAQREMVADFFGEIMFNGKKYRTQTAQALADETFLTLFDKDEIAEFETNSMAALAEISENEPNIFKQIVDWVKRLILKLRGTRIKADAILADELERNIKMLEDYVKQVYNSRDTKKIAENGGVEFKKSLQNNYDYSKSFAQQIDDYKSGKIPNGDTLLVGATPELFLSIGFNALPMTMNTTHVDYALNGTKDIDHHLGEEMLKQLPESIKEPIAIFISQTKGNTSVVALLNFEVNGKQTVASIVIDGFGFQNKIRIDSNAITSVYGKGSAINRLYQAAQDEANDKFSLLYANKKEADSLLQSAGHQLSGGLIPHDGFYHSIRENGSPVKSRFNDVTETQQFKRWFGDWQKHQNTASKIVDKFGKPLVMYYVTDVNFTGFNTDNQKTNSELNFGKGIYLTPNKNLAEKYTTTGKVMSLYVDVKNPYEIFSTRLDDFDLKKLSAEFDENVTVDNIDKILRKKGYDGIIVRDHNRTTNPINQVVVFNSNQVKSATDNIGTFDANNGNIKFATTSQMQQFRYNPETYRESENVEKNTADDVGVSYSVAYTTDNRPVAVIDEDILDGVPKSQWVQTVKNTIAKNFSGGIPISGRLIKVNKITRSEYTNSKYSKYLKSSDGTIYHDKLKTANNLDDIVLASTNYINEDLKHIRKDSFKEFARGDVLIRVGGNDYSAKVIVGFTNSQQMVLYDVVDFTQTSFKIKERTSPTAMQNAGSDRNVMPSDITVPQKAQSVNTSISEKDTFSDVLVSNDPKRYAQGEHQLNVSNESIYNFETDVKQKQSDIIPENDDVKQMERENLESYTETQYNDFGWVRYNDILSAKEYSALLSRYADYKRNKNHYPTTRFGEAVIFSFDYTNILMYVKGAIRSPQITKVLTIDSELPLITQGTIQKEILSNERKQLLFPYETVTDFFGEGCFAINKERDFSSFQEYKRRSKREFSGEDNTYHRNKQNGTRDGKTSETFDKSEYIKRSDRDTLGNTLTEAQQSYFADSKVRDETGNLKVMYHGTPNATFTYKEYNRLIYKKPIKVSKQDWAKVNSRRTQKYAHISDENVPVLDLIKLAEYNRINEAYGYVIRNNDKYSFNIVSKRKIKSEFNGIYKEESKSNEKTYSQNDRNGNREGFNRRSSEPPRYGGTIRENVSEIRQSSESEYDSDFGYGASYSGRGIGLSTQGHVQAVDNDNITGQNNFAENGGEVKYSFAGYAEDGKGMYKSNFPKGTPKIAKAQRILSYIQDVWSKKPIKLNITDNEGNIIKTIDAQFDPTYENDTKIVTDASKLMGGNRHGSASEQRVTLDLADDYYQIASESKYNYSKSETGKNKPTHDGVREWHYFVNDIYFAEYDSNVYKPYTVSINVKEKPDGNFVYSFSAEKQKENSTQQTLHAVVSEEIPANAKLFKDIISEDDMSVNTSISENDSVYSDGFINREAYYDKLRSRQAFDVDLSQIEERYWDAYEKAAESGVLNNTKRTHEFVDMIAKISADKGVPFDFVNNEKIVNSSFAAEDKIVNGYLDEDGNIVINIESPKALESTVGHEITHILEGTELYDTLETAITEYAKQKGEYEDRFAALTELYKNVEGADVNKELVADLVGDYLFTDKDFVRRLFNEHRNIFEKIFDEIKYLLRIVTAGSKEARQIEKVKKAFEDAYRESGKVQKNTAENSGEKYSLTIKHTDGSVEKLADARNLTDEQAINYLYQAKRGELQGHTYIPVRKDTPQVVIDTLKAVGYEVNNLSMIMQVGKAQQAMSEKSKSGKTVKHGSNIRDHALTAEEVVEIVNNLDDPNMMILQTNRQGKNGTQLPNNVVVFVGYGNNSKEGTAVIEFEASIDPEYIGAGFGETDYHTVVTVFEPDIERNGEYFDYAEELLLNPNNFELKIEKRQPTGSVTREKHPNTSSEFPFFNESVAQTETDVKQRQLDIIPENDDVQQMGRGNLESYTETQYNNFGWVRYNDVLSAAEYNTLLSRYADHKHNKDNYPTTRFGEAVIYSYDYPNILMYVKGTIKHPQITKIIKTKDSLPPEMQSEIQEEILHNERRYLPFPYETIIDFYGEELFSIVKARNYETFRQIKSRAKGESGKGSNTVSEIEQNGTRGGITSKTTDKSEYIKRSDRDILTEAQQEGITGRYLNMRAEKNTFSEGDVKNSFRNSKSGMANDLLLPYDNELSELIEKRGDYIIDSFEKLKDVVNLAFDKPQLKATAYFGIIPVETLSKIEKNTPNIPKELNGTLFNDGKTYSVAATLDSIKHLADDKNLSRKDIIEYLDRMADTIIDFDTVNFDYYQGSNKSNGVIFKKTFEDGTMRSFEIVSNNKKTLNLQTLYMESGDYQKNKSAETLLMKNSSANAQGAGRSDSMNSIPQTSQKSQEKFSENSDHDTLGNTLTETQQSYFSGSKVRDENIPVFDSIKLVENVNASKYNENSPLSFENRANENSRSSINWVYKAKIFSQVENKLFHQKISEINQDSDAFSKNSVGEYMLPIENKIVFTDGNYDSPYISEIVEVLTDYSTDFEKIKERIFNVERGKSDKEKEGRIIRQMFGEGFVISYRSEVDGVYEWESGKRKGKTRRTVISNYLRKQDGERNATESKETSIKFSDRNNYWYPNMSKSEIDYVRRIAKHELYTTDNYIDNDNKWLYNEKNGNTYFALYSTADANEPTVLYASKGKRAEIEYQFLIEQFGDEIDNDGSINKRAESIDKLLSSYGYVISGQNVSNRNVMGGRSNNRNAISHIKNTRIRPGEALLDCLRNIREIQGRNERNRVVQYSNRYNNSQDVTADEIESVSKASSADDAFFDEKNYSLSYAFNSNPIKSVANAKPTIDSDIRYSLSDISSTKRKPIISKLTNREISEQTYVTLDKLGRGEAVALEELDALPEVKEGKEKVKEYIAKFLEDHPEFKDVPLKELGTYLIDSAEREQLRSKLLQDRLKSGSFTGLDNDGNEVYNSGVEKGKRLDIVIGLPAAGKSTSIVLPLSQYYKSVVVDSDIIKHELPEFNEGWGASLVHEESSALNLRMLGEELAFGNNIVLPIVGAKTSSIEKYLELAKNKGYDVHLHLNELKSSKAMGRMLGRYFSQGRFIPPAVSYKYGDKPTAIYEEMKNRSDLSGYSHWNNDVAKGQRPTLTDVSGNNRALAAFSRTWRAVRGTDAQRNDSESQSRKSQPNEIATIKETSSADDVFFDREPKYSIPLKYDFDSPVSIGTRKNLNTKISSDDIKYIENICKNLGRKVVFEDLRNISDINGNTISPDGYIKDGVIYINLYAENPIGFVLKHEITHFGEKTEEYKEFVSRVKKSKIYENWLEEKTGESDLKIAEYIYKKRVVSSRSEISRINDPKAEAELIADFAGDMLFTDNGSGMTAIISEVEVKHRNAFVQFILDLISYIKKKLSGKSFIDFQLSVLEDSYNRMISEATDLERNGVYSYDNQVSYCFALCKDQSKIEVAEQMEADGEDYKTIFSETGLIRDAFGVWLFELDTRHFTIYPEGNAGTEKHFYNNQLKWRNGMLECTLNDIIVYRELYQNYPELRNLKVILQDSYNADDTLKYIPTREALVINKKFFDDYENNKNEVKAEMLGALQTVVQHLDGRSSNISLEKLKVLEEKDQLPYTDLHNRKFTAEEASEYIYDNYEVGLVKQRAEKLLSKSSIIGKVQYLPEYLPDIDYDNIIVPYENDSVVTLKGKKKIEINRRIDAIADQIINDTIGVDTINTIEEVADLNKECLSRPETYIIDTAARDEIRLGILQKLIKYGSAVIDNNGNIDYNGEIKQDFRADIVIGLPASNSAEALVNSLSNIYSSRVVEADMVKEWVPEYDDGLGSKAVDIESRNIADEVMKYAAENSENIVCRVIGEDYSYLVQRIKFLKEKGYNVYLHLDEISNRESLGRSLKKYIDTGEFTPTETILEYGNKPTENFDRIINDERLVDGYSHSTNYELNDELPKLIKNSKEIKSNTEIEKADSSIEPASSFEDKKSTVNSSFKNALEKAKTTNVLRKFLTYVQYHSKKDISGKQNIRAGSDDLIANVAKSAKQAAGYFNTQKIKEFSKRVISEFDSVGRKFADNILQKFKDTFFKNEKGQLVSLYVLTMRGFGGFKRSQLGLVAGTLESVLETYDREMKNRTQKLTPSIIEIKVNMTNPLKLPFTPEKFTAQELLPYLLEKGIISQSDYNRINKLDGAKTKLKYDGYISTIIRGYIEDAGYDGIIYFNNTTDIGSMSVVIFNEDQIVKVAKNGVLIKGNGITEDYFDLDSIEESNSAESNAERLKYYISDSKFNKRASRARADERIRLGNSGFMERTETDAQKAKQAIEENLKGKSSLELSGKDLAERDIGDTVKAICNSTVFKDKYGNLLSFFKHDTSVLNIAKMIKKGIPFLTFDSALREWIIKKEKTHLTKYGIMQEFYINSVNPFVMTSNEWNSQKVADLLLKEGKITQKYYSELFYQTATKMSIDGSVGQKLVNSLMMKGYDSIILVNDMGETMVIVFEENQIIPVSRNGMLAEENGIIQIDENAEIFDENYIKSVVIDSERKIDVKTEKLKKELEMATDNTQKMKILTEFLMCKGQPKLENSEGIIAGHSGAFESCEANKWSLITIISKLKERAALNIPTADTDIAGRKIVKGIRDALDGSILKDKNGRPYSFFCYNTHGEFRFKHSQFGLCLSSLKATHEMSLAERAKHPNTVKAAIEEGYAIVKNPYTINFEPENLTPALLAEYMYHESVITEKQYKSVLSRVGADRATYNSHASLFLIEILMSKGFDSISFENESYDPGSKSVILFSESQFIPIASNGLPTENSYSLSNNESGSKNVEKSREVVIDLSEDSGYNIKKKKKYEHHRPRYIENFKEMVLYICKDPITGLIYDPTGVVIDEEQYETFEMGHRPGQEYRKIHEKYMNDEMTDEEFEAWYNDPANYRVELVSTNRSHKFESHI